MEENKPFLQIAIAIVFLFVVSMFYTFIGEWLKASGFFGDSYHVDCDWQQCFNEKPHYHWGTRRYLFAVMNALLFVLGLIRMGYVIYKIVIKSSKDGQTN